MTTRPTRRIRWTLYAVGASVWASGVLYWVFDRYFLRQTNIGIEQNPLQVWWLRAHALTATVAVWLLGYICAVHVQRNWSAGLRRSSGLLFVTVFGLLVFSGYLLYYVDADRPAALIADIHWAVGVCTTLAFLIHRGLRRQRAKPARAGELERLSARR
ncbi:MAG: hypothetical protein ACRETK_00945 [Steroidobacteraceae bacterium]